MSGSILADIFARAILRSALCGHNPGTEFNALTGRVNILRL